MTEQQIYRVSWEMVKQFSLVKYMNADPTFYSNCMQTVPNSEIPEEDWRLISKETDDPWDQFRTLRQWASEDREFVRNVRLERCRVEREWEPVTVL